MRLRIFTLICILAFTVARLHGQASPTASRAGDLQIGAMFNLANSDYRPDYFKGYGFYTTYDFMYHVGIEGEFHQINDPNPVDGVRIYERTYEIGPRYVQHYGRFTPYAKVMYGRGVFQLSAPHRRSQARACRQSGLQHICCRRRCRLSRYGRTQCQGRFRIPAMVELSA